MKEWESDREKLWWLDGKLNGRMEKFDKTIFVAN